MKIELMRVPIFPHCFGKAHAQKKWQSHIFYVRIGFSHCSGNAHEKSSEATFFATSLQA